MPIHTSTSPAWALNAAVVLGDELLFHADSHSATKVGAAMTPPQDQEADTVISTDSTVYSPAALAAESPVSASDPSKVPPSAADQNPTAATSPFEATPSNSSPEADSTPPATSHDTATRAAVVSFDPELFGVAEWSDAYARADSS